jgi:AcrR family transcriptional regulator
VTTSVPSTSEPDERHALLLAALEILREQGTQGLRVDDLLRRTGLGTRAFYRHFESKDHLVVTVFAGAAQAEADRLRSQMGADADPLTGVVAWINGRLDLAFDAGIQSDLKYVSQQAQAVNATAPETMAAVHRAMLEPLVEQLSRGVAEGVFIDINPVADALHIDSVTWGCIERQWAAGDVGVLAGDPDLERSLVLAFCLRGLGVRRG